MTMMMIVMMMMMIMRMMVVVMKVKVKVKVMIGIEPPPVCPTANPPVDPEDNVRFTTIKRLLTRNKRQIFTIVFVFSGQKTYEMF